MDPRIGFPEPGGNPLEALQSGLWRIFFILLFALFMLFLPTLIVMGLDVARLYAQNDRTPITLRGAPWPI